MHFIRKHFNFHMLFIAESQHRHKKAVYYSASILEGLTSNSTYVSNGTHSSHNKTKLFTTHIEPLRDALKHISNNLLAHRVPAFRVPDDLKKLQKSLFGGSCKKAVQNSQQQQKETDKFLQQQIQNHSKEFLSDRHVNCFSSSCLKVIKSCVHLQSWPKVLELYVSFPSLPS